MDLFSRFRHTPPPEPVDLPWPKPVPVVKAIPVPHKFFDWTLMPASEIAALEDPTRCCNLTTGRQFCIVCYHTPDCPCLNHPHG